jgi:hypothetical protein
MTELELQATRLSLAESVSQGKLIARRPGQARIPDTRLGPITQEFFAEYALVQSPLGGLVVATSEIAPSEYLAGFISIGHSEDWDVVQRPGADEVFVVEGSEDEEELAVRFPTVFHFLVAEANA